MSRSQFPVCRPTLSLNNESLLSFAAAQSLITWSPPSVPQSIDGLLELVANRHYRAAVQLTHQLIDAAQRSPGNDAHHMQLWSIRCHLLYALGEVHTVFEELGDGLGDLPELHAEADDGRWPFSLRLLHAIVHALNNQDTVTSIHRCNAIVGAIKTILLLPDLPSTSRNLWTRRLANTHECLARVMLIRQDFDVCQSELCLALSLLPDDETRFRGQSICVALQCGNTDEAAAQLLALHPPHKALYTGLLEMCHGRVNDAHSSFTAASSANNMAVTSLYQANVTDAVDTLRKMLVDRRVDCTDTALLNMATLYEVCTLDATPYKEEVLKAVLPEVGDAPHRRVLKIV